METKYCHKCDTERSVEEFSKSKLSKDGFQTQCKHCNKIANKRFRKARPEYQHKYYHTPSGRKAKLAAQKAYYDSRGGGIYVIVNKVDGSVYVGQTTQFMRREHEWSTYMSEERWMKRYMSQAFKNAIESYGKESFEWMVLEKIANPTPYKLRKRENFYIEKFSLITNVYNLRKNKV